MKKRMLSILLMCVLTVGMLAGCGGNKTDNSGTSASVNPEDYGTIPEVSLSFATEPYPDHTVPYIGIEQNYFEDVGIKLKTVDAIDADKLPSVLESGQYDFASGAPSLFIPSMQEGDVTTFVYSNLFLGYCLMGPSDAKSYDDFIAEGKSSSEAIQACMQQLKGKTFTYPSESAIQAFIQTIFNEGNVNIDDIDTVIVSDDNGVALMLSGDAQYKVGAVPATATLTSDGFKCILSAKNLVESAEASADNENIRSVFQNGWTTTKKFYDKNHETILRLASVCFRINQYVCDEPENAAAIHVQYLNKLAGTSFTEEQVVGLYKSEIPLYSFDMQSEWFNDTSNPLYYSYTVDSTIKMYEQEGVLPEGKYTADDIVSADDVYKELSEYKTEAEDNLKKLEGASGDAAEIAKKAQKQYDIYDYYDAAVFSEQALSLMK